MDVGKSDVEPVDMECQPTPAPEKMDTDTAHLETHASEQPENQTKTRPRSRSKVHFPEDVTDHSDILISREIDSAIDVNVGFLQTDHRYQIKCALPDTLKGDIIAAKNSNVVIKSVEASPRIDENGHDITIEMVAHRDGILAETFTLSSKEDEGRVVKVVLRARILAKDQGRPMLKEGITTIGIELEESSSGESDRDTND